MRLRWHKRLRGLDGVGGVAFPLATGMLASDVRSLAGPSARFGMASSVSLQHGEWAALLPFDVNQLQAAPVAMACPWRIVLADVRRLFECGIVLNSLEIIAGLQAIAAPRIGRGGFMCSHPLPTRTRQICAFQGHPARRSAREFPHPCRKALCVFNNLQLST